MKAEFFLDKTGTFKKQLYFKLGENGEWRKYADLSDMEIEAIFHHLKKFKNAWTGLLHLSHFLTGKREILKQFIMCNWTSMDKHWDISKKQLRFETVDCPFKSAGGCPFDGIDVICQKS